jgi:RNA polymerase sigma factor (sigma-70 family)
VHDTHHHFLAQLEAHKKILYKVARVYCSNAADRQDLMQDIVVALWRSFDRFDGRSKFSTWMYRVALNVALLWVRGQGDARHTVCLDDAILTIAEAEDDDLAPELRIFLNQILAQLPALDRALILLTLEGHDHPAIADMLGLSTTNVATRLARIRQRLRDQFKE